MLHAEIHGHAAPEVQGNEDYLTSEIFGHLRYLPPSVFWDDFLSCAQGLAENGAEQTLTAYLDKKAGVSISDYSTLKVQTAVRSNAVQHAGDAFQRDPELYAATDVALGPR
jgi:hypothetical protein